LRLLRIDEEEIRLVLSFIFLELPKDIVFLKIACNSIADGKIKSKLKK